MIDDFRESSLKTTSEIAEFLEEKHTLNMAKFNNPHFLIAALLFILDQASAKKGVFGFLATIFDDGQPGLSGLEVIFIIVGVLALLISIVSCCLKCRNCDDEENQEAPAQLESVHSVQHGFDKSSNNQPLEWFIPPPPYPPQLQPVNNPEQVTRFGSRC